MVTEKHKQMMPLSRVFAWRTSRRKFGTECV